MEVLGEAIGDDVLCSFDVLGIVASFVVDEVFGVPSGNCIMDW